MDWQAKQAQKLVELPVDEDEGSPPQGGANRTRFRVRKNRQISGSPPGRPHPRPFPSRNEIPLTTLSGNRRDKRAGSGKTKGTEKKVCG